MCQRTHRSGAQVCIRTSGFCGFTFSTPSQVDDSIIFLKRLYSNTDSTGMRLYMSEGFFMDCRSTWASLGAFSVTAWAGILHFVITSYNLSRRQYNASPMPLTFRHALSRSTTSAWYAVSFTVLIGAMGLTSGTSVSPPPQLFCEKKCKRCNTSFFTSVKVS